MISIYDINGQLQTGALNGMFDLTLEAFLSAVLCKQRSRSKDRVNPCRSHSLLPNLWAVRVVQNAVQKQINVRLVFEYSPTDTADISC